MECTNFFSKDYRESLLVCRVVASSICREPRENYCVQSAKWRFEEGRPCRVLYIFYANVSLGSQFWRMQEGEIVTSRLFAGAGQHGPTAGLGFGGVGFVEPRIFVLSFPVPRVTTNDEELEDRERKMQKGKDGVEKG